jgi:hypothetical protein
MTSMSQSMSLRMNEINENDIKEFARRILEGKGIPGRRTL